MSNSLKKMFIVKVLLIASSRVCVLTRCNLFYTWSWNFSTQSCWTKMGYHSLSLVIAILAWKCLGHDEKKVALHHVSSLSIHFHTTKDDLSLVQFRIPANVCPYHSCLQHAKFPWKIIEFEFRCSKMFFVHRSLALPKLD